MFTLKVKHPFKMDSLRSFSSPAGILTATNAALSVGTLIWTNTKISEIHTDIDVIHTNIKKNTDDILKIREYLKLVDPKQIPKIVDMIDQIVRNINSLNNKVEHITNNLNVQEEKNIIRDKNIISLYNYISQKDLNNSPKYEEYTYTRKETIESSSNLHQYDDDNDDDDISKIIAAANFRE